MPGNLKSKKFHWAEVAPKGRKSTDRNQYLISFEDGRDKSAHKIPGYSSNAFSEKMPGNLAAGTRYRKSVGRSSGYWSVEWTDGRKDGRMDRPKT